MGKIEDIERQVQALSAEELAQFRAWFLEFDWPARDHQIARESRRVDSTPSLRRPCATTHPGRPRPFDSPRIPGFLGVLPVLAAGTQKLADAAYARLKQDHVTHRSISMTERPPRRRLFRLRPCILGLRSKSDAWAKMRSTVHQVTSLLAAAWATTLLPSAGRLVRRATWFQDTYS